MLIFSPSTMHLDRWLDKSSIFSRFLLIGLSVIFAFISLFFPAKVQKKILLEETKQKSKRTIFSYEAIGSGALALHPRYAFGWISRLADELILIAYNSRPDVETKDAKILISLKNGKQQKTLPSGSMIYLKETEQGKGLLVSEEVTNLWAKPILLENGAVLIEACRSFTTSDGEVKDEKGEYVAAGQNGSSAARYSPAGQIFANALKSARGYPKDLLIQKYGGSEYNPWTGKIALELSRGNSSYACFIASDDYLLYEKEEWRVCPFEELKKDHPIAHIKTISGNSIMIEMWDEMGYSPFQVKIEMNKPERARLKPEIKPTSVRLRNRTQVSCAFGKKRMILRQGDWLLKTSSGWRNLRRAEEVEQYLYHRLKGELLIFDSIENEHGNFIMKGHMFDETRMQMQPLSLPIATDKSQGKSSRKRKPIFSPRERRGP